MVERRLWSWAALVLGAETAVLALAVAVDRFPEGLAVLACLLSATVVGWEGVCRGGVVRRIALTAALVLVLAAVAIEFVEEHLVQDVLLVVGVGGTLTAARRAFLGRVHWPPAAPPLRPVLLYNPLSGNGRLDRNELLDAARFRSIRLIEIAPGSDLDQLAREAVAAGADALAVAGGDGSQAAVAAVAAELGIPYACIPVGTHNHFALDLGVDRADPIGALDAFVDGAERRVDLAEVNGWTFVNGVSLGVYADAVRRPEYREAKLQTLLDAVPDALGPTAEPIGLQWSGGQVNQHVVAMVVSNNPYRLGHALGSGTRPRLDRGVLGITTVTSVEGHTETSVSRRLVIQQWSAQSLEIGARGPLAAGIDGEPTQLNPPLRFRIRPGVLRVRLSRHHRGVSPSALWPETFSAMIHALVVLAVRGTDNPGEGNTDRPLSAGR